MVDGNTIKSNGLTRNILTDSPKSEIFFTTNKFYIPKGFIKGNRINFLVLAFGWMGAATIALGFFIYCLYLGIMHRDINYLPLFIVSIFAFIIFSIIFFPFRIGNVVISSEKFVYHSRHPLFYFSERIELDLHATSNVEYDINRKRITMDCNGIRREILLKGLPSEEFNTIIQVISQKDNISIVPTIPIGK